MSIINGEAISNESITVSSTALGFTKSKTAIASATGTVQAGKAEFKVETAPIRFTRDGTNPVAGTTGILGDIGDIVTVEGIVNIDRFRMIRETSTDADVRPEYLR